MNLFIHTINKPSESQRVQCDRDRIRTYDRLLRRQMLYPAELRDLIKNPCKSITYKGLSGETGIRTQATLSRWQISNLLHYHSGTSPKSKLNRSQKYIISRKSTTYWRFNCCACQSHRFGVHCIWWLPILLTQLLMLHKT